ncbi:MAG: fatty acid desaturase [Alphaproteobacteria bacterium]|nr:fatty acid desaturase [Alphaproteobacteria bacterium]
MRDAPGIPSSGGVPEIKENIRLLVEHCKQYRGAETRAAVIQLANTLIPFFAICAAMLWAFENHYWLTGLLTIPAAGLLVRLFIIQHDCGHGSFFKSRRANTLTGHFISLLTWTPYEYWRKTHNLHHATSGNLDKRGHGAIETLTTEEFDALSPGKKIYYRLYRNPVVMLILGTPLFIIIGQRFPLTEPFPFVDTSKSLPFAEIFRSVMILNVGLLAVYGGLGFVTGHVPLMLAYLPIVAATAWIGGWLFYIQHQFEHTYWDHAEEWEFHEAAVLGSSYLHLPPVLQWFTGNIGLHHIHHLCSAIPNYRLQKCLDASPVLQSLNRITLKDTVKCLKLALWDKDSRRLVAFH